MLQRGAYAAWLGAIAFAGALSAAARAQPPVLLDEMDGSRPALRLAAAPAGVQIVRQVAAAGEGGVGRSEHLSLTIPPGSSAPLAYSLPAATVIVELRLTAAVRCNRPGTLLAATVVLPRSLDPATGQPLKLLVRSDAQEQTGDWVELTFANLPLALERQARVARTQQGPEIDTRGAYISELVILAPGGLGVTELWVDRIAMYGPLRPGPVQNGASSPVDVAAAWSARPAENAATTSPRAAEPPGLPRIIQWQGEPFELLKRIGFDAAWLGRPASDRELEEAARAGLWLVCPPPTAEELQREGIGDRYARVLAWDLGELAPEDDIGSAEAWARLIERHEKVQSRPKVLRPLGTPREASRIAEALVLGRPTLGSTASWTEHAAWLAQQRRLARPGSAVWAAISTHPTSESRSQLAALRGGAPGAGAASYQHLAQATAATFGVWPRAFYFQSQASLASGDADARMRALALELANLRLGMVEPWLAHGKAATPARCVTHPDLTAMVLTVERSHLVAPVRWNPAAAVDGPVTLLLPGTPESCDAYLLSVAGPRRLVTRRVTGGLSVTVENLPDDAFLLLTEDGYAFAQVERFLRKHGARAAQARVELAALRRQQADRAAAALSPAVLEASGAKDELARVDASMTAIHQTLRGQDYATAFARAADAEHILDDLQDRVYSVVWADRQGGSSPFDADWATLVDTARVADAVDRARTPQAPIPAGDFESLEALLAHGWQRSEGAPPGISGSVRLSPDGPQSGAYCLELAARLSTDEEAPPALAAPPVWVTSPPLTVGAGQLVEISGWVRVLEKPIGSADPVLVFDSIGGETAALRIASAPTWQRFRLVRAAPPGAECRVTIALGGIGRAAVDSLGYRLIPAGPSALPVAAR